MAREHKVWVVYGYSRLIQRGDPYWNLFAPLEEVLGHFDTIAFKVLRFGEEFFEITMRRLGTLDPSTVSGKTEINETVAGKVGDHLQLKNGEFLIIEKVSQEASQLELRFWCNNK